MKKIESDPTTQTGVLAILDSKLATIRERDKALLAEQIALEKNTVVPIAPTVAANPGHMAMQMLGGNPVDIKAYASPGERLHAILVEREAIKQALEMGRRQAGRQRLELAAQAIKNHSDEWNENVRQTALTLLHLRHLNVARATMRQAITATMGISLPMPIDRSTGPIFGPPIVGDEVYRFLQHAVQAGIITEKEVKNAN